LGPSFSGQIATGMVCAVCFSHDGLDASSQEIFATEAALGDLLRV